MDKHKKASFDRYKDEVSETDRQIGIIQRNHCHKCGASFQYEKSFFIAADMDVWWAVCPECMFSMKSTVLEEYSSASLLNKARIEIEMRMPTCAECHSFLELKQCKNKLNRDVEFFCMNDDCTNSYFRQTLFLPCSVCGVTVHPGTEWKKGAVVKCPSPICYYG